MNFERSSGVLLHPTSLPGPYGIGDIGPEAYHWIDFLADAGCRLWQILPLGPTGYGDSPYQCFSAFAGNPYLISPELLLEDGLLDPYDFQTLPDFPKDRVDFGSMIPWKLRILDLAFIRFQQVHSPGLIDEFNMFREKYAHWLSDFALFMALKENYGGGSWVNWPEPIRTRAPEAIEKARKKYYNAINQQEFHQFLFFRQWEALKTYANSRGVLIIGDVPIFVAHDSAEVWAQPNLFYLYKSGKPTVVAGVPPDYFSKTGQLWGNPLYRWDEHAKNEYRWWLSRLRAVLNLVDIVRLDHFRGFAGYWEVSARAKTAVKGRWVTGPGQAFFQAVADKLGDLPIIAEDLGVITPDVIEIRERFRLPGMSIIQFAFHGDPKEPFLPHNHIENCVIYTGTHDNDTSCGWYERINEKERDFYRRYLGRDGHDVAWDFIRACWSSVAVFALAPMQDLLSLGNEARMNYPGSPSGNWSWRMPEDALSETVMNRLMEFNYLYSRTARQKMRV